MTLRPVMFMFMYTEHVDMSHDPVEDVARHTSRYRMYTRCTFGRALVFVISFCKRRCHPRDEWKRRTHTSHRGKVYGNDEWSRNTYFAGKPRHRASLARLLGTARGHLLRGRAYTYCASRPRASFEIHDQEKYLIQTIFRNLSLLWRCTLLRLNFDIYVYIWTIVPDVLQSFI